MRRLCFAFLFSLFCSAASGGCDQLSDDPASSQVVAADTSSGFTINPASGWPDPGQGQNWIRLASTVTGTGAWNVGLSLPVGITVPQIATSIIDSSTSDVVMMLVSYSGASLTTFTILGQANSNGTGAQTLIIPGGHVVTSTDSLVIRFTTPGSTSTPTVGAIGVGAIPALASTKRVHINAAAAATNTDAPAAILGAGTTWYVTNPTRLFYPLSMATGDRITGYRVWAGKFSDLHTVLCARLFRSDSSLTVSGNGGNTVEVNKQCSSASSPGAITLGADTISEVVGDGASYSISVDSSSGSAVDMFGDAELTFATSP